MRSSTTIHVALFYPKNFGLHPLCILPLLIYTSPWPSLPLHHLLILVSTFKFLGLLCVRLMCNSCTDTFHLIKAQVPVLVMTLWLRCIRSSICMIMLHLVEVQVPLLLMTLRLRSTRSSYCMTMFHLIEVKVPLLVMTLLFTVHPVVQKWSIDWTTDCNKSDNKSVVSNRKLLKVRHSCDLWVRKSFFRVFYSDTYSNA
jgi:hypothetical protein